MEILREKKKKVSRVVYIQFRQAERGKDGRLRVVRTKVRTVGDATIEAVEAITMKALAAV